MLETNQLHFAVRKAIEKGVVDVINLGVEKGLWEFEPIKEVQIPEIKDYVDIQIFQLT